VQQLCLSELSYPLVYCSYREEAKLLIIWQKVHQRLAETQLGHSKATDFLAELHGCLERQGISVRPGSKQLHGIWLGLEPRHQREVLKFILDGTSMFDTLGVRAAEQEASARP
jgi:hypothetical protein